MVNGGGAIDSAKTPLAVRDVLSVTVTVRLKFPEIVGVPVITPSAESESPAGAEPDHRYGGAPPDAVSAKEYCEPTAPLGAAKEL